MRYASCTAQDVKFLKLLVINQKPGKNSSLEKKDSAVITALNSQKDRINEIGVKKFAKDHNKKLHLFYSIDSIVPPKTVTPGKKLRFIDVSTIAPSLQEKLWGLPPSAGKEQIASRLSLCKGMPVMIRNNNATELCITKGQDGTVWGWDSSVLPDGKKTLRTLFIKLNKPPCSVKFPGLPKNVVPIPTVLHGPLAIRTPSGDHLTLKRWQVPALPFFVMTDYASQGKTHETNIVDLGRSQNHQAVYTALSRSAMAQGTAILQAFDDRKITSGISGHLRQEFRELEILNKMTLMLYNKLIPEEAIAELRNPTLKSYYNLKKTMPGTEIDWHTALQVWPDQEDTIQDLETALWDINENNAARLKYAQKKEQDRIDKQKKEQLTKIYQHILATQTQSCIHQKKLKRQSTHL
ncbi:hypothetical protein GALMADRAFT_67450 [Galerina marginata CBS 339.88]|uniref:ATP-dependent DNA helicase n=1 Tax=Galerina marginata (strain CBS 339.88) TaxID=685588 RepID=A0A067SYR9_GALM3|nr:hypothetical protein GALMADRAFT_67450 [Galerina marginata CBS 339.88]